jgi:hypothetical protein
MAASAACGWDTSDTSDHGPTRDGLPGGRHRPDGVRAECDGALTGDYKPPFRLREVLREGIVDGRWLEERLGVTFRSSGVADDVKNGRRIRHVEGRARAAQDLENGLTYVGDEGVDVNQRLDVATVRTGVRDYYTAV